MKNLINHSIDLMKLLAAIIIASIYKIFNRDKIYLIGERKDQCQDNGYHLFKYVRENHKNDKFYYCITKDSKQLDKIDSFGNIVYYKSFKHYLYYVLSDKLICAHVGSCTPDTPLVWKAEEKGFIKKNRVFIQHGITKETLPQLMYPKVNFSTFVCGAKPEYEFVKNKFNFPSGVVKYLGLCRFDNLHDIKTKKQILIMPTWRQWFGMDGNNKMSEEEFVKSEYFLRFNELINNAELNEIIKDKDMTVIFYPHNEIQRYVHLFSTKYNKVIIASKNNYDVQSLLKESEILITDYSSIAFDFAYMRKAIIYYQFDKGEYEKKHYSNGYFDYEKDGFGAVVDNISSVIQQISILLNNKQKDKYINRSKKFFQLYDKDNCKRNYEEIVKEDW